MGSHDQIVYHEYVHLGLCNLPETVPTTYVHIYIYICECTSIRHSFVDTMRYIWLLDGFPT